MLGTDGFVDMLKDQEYTRELINMEILEETLLKYSNSIHLDDDLTIIEIRFRNT